MELTKLYEARSSHAEIICGAIINDHECVILMTDGHVLRWDAALKEGKYLFQVTADPAIQWRTSGFDLTAKCTLYAMDQIVVLVNDLKIHGFVYNGTTDRYMRIEREDYHADISSYPIALFKYGGEIPHLMHSVAWNHLQVMNLDTMQVLTADKSLIQESAEEKHLKIVSEYGPGNNLPWPSPYDYFFANLAVSPDHKKVLSRGWGWGSYDSLRVYDLEHFIQNNRIREYQVVGGEHLERAGCWVDDKTIAIAYNEAQEDINNSRDGKTEVVLFDISGEKSVESGRFSFDAFDGVYGELHYSKELNVFIGFAEERGLTVCSPSGEVLLKDESFKPNGYNAASNQFWKIDGGDISVYQLTMSATSNTDQ